MRTRSSLLIALGLMVFSASASAAAPCLPIKKVDVCIKIGSKSKPYQLVALPQIAATLIVKFGGGVLASNSYVDGDADGYGKAGSAPARCPTPGYVANATDCNDASWGVNPASAETCGDGVDQNCNGQVDEGCAACPCFAQSDLDATHAAWVAEGWTSGSEQCLEGNGTNSSSLTINFYGERYGNNAGYELSQYYSITYNEYGESFCSRYRHRYDLDPATGEMVRTGYEDSTTPITGAQDDACRDVVDHWASDHGLACTAP